MTALLLPVLFRLLKVWAAVKLRLAAAGLLLTSARVTPAASLAKALAAVRLTSPESMLMGPLTASTEVRLRMLLLPPPEKVSPLLPVMREEIVEMPPSSV